MLRCESSLHPTRTESQNHHSTLNLRVAPLSWADKSATVIVYVGCVFTAAALGCQVFFWIFSVTYRFCGFFCAHQGLRGAAKQIYHARAAEDASRRPGRLRGLPFPWSRSFPSLIRAAWTATYAEFRASSPARF